MTTPAVVVLKDGQVLAGWEAEAPKMEQLLKVLPGQARPLTEKAGDSLTGPIPQPNPRPQSKSHWPMPRKAHGRILKAPRAGLISSILVVRPLSTASLGMTNFAVRSKTLGNLLRKPLALATPAMAALFAGSGLLPVFRFTHHRP